MTTGSGSSEGKPSRQSLTGRGAAAYQGALEAVLAIAIAGGAGYWADERFGTAPRWLITGLVLGFGAFVLRLWRMRRLFERDLPPGADGNG